MDLSRDLRIVTGVVGSTGPGAQDSQAVESDSMPDTTEAVAQLIRESRSGDENTFSRLFLVVYRELRGVAGKYMHREAHQSLRATDLVHEAYLRLLGESQLHWKDRAHLLGIAARSMRQILVERARARQTQKRGGGHQAVTLTDETLGETARSIDFLALDQALQALAKLDSKQAQLVELRFFGGLTLEETSEVMGISPATAKRWWALSRAWLRRELST